MVKFHKPSIQNRALMYEAPWLCHRNKAHIQFIQSFLEVRVSAAQVFMYSYDSTLNFVHTYVDICGLLFLIYDEYAYCHLVYGGRRSRAIFCHAGFTARFQAVPWCSSSSVHLSYCRTVRNEQEAVSKAWVPKTTRRIDKRAQAEGHRLFLRRSILRSVPILGSRLWSACTLIDSSIQVKT